MKLDRCMLVIFQLNCFLVPFCSLWISISTWWFRKTHVSLMRKMSIRESDTQLIIRSWKIVSHLDLHLTLYSREHELGMVFHEKNLRKCEDTLIFWYVEDTDLRVGGGIEPSHFFHVKLQKVNRCEQEVTQLLDAMTLRRLQHYNARVEEWWVQVRTNVNQKRIYSDESTRFCAKDFSWSTLHEKLNIWIRNSWLMIQTIPRTWILFWYSDEYW
jgi:hypothetical protein